MLLYLLFSLFSFQTARQNSPHCSVCYSQTIAPLGGSSSFPKNQRFFGNPLRGLTTLLMGFGTCVPGGGKESRTPDPLLARQVLSQLSYTPTSSKLAFLLGLLAQNLALSGGFSSFPKDKENLLGALQNLRFCSFPYISSLWECFAKLKLDFGGLKWTRTTDLTLIRRVL